MTEQTVQDQQLETIDGMEDSVPAISNAELKAHPVFQKLASKLSSYEQREAERKAEAQQKAEAEEVAKRDEELKTLEEQSRFKEALEMREREIEKIRADSQTKIVGLKLENQLIAEGYKNKYFLKGVISDFKGDEDAIAEYVKAITDDESNKVYMGGASEERSLTPPPGVGSVSQTSKTMPVETLKAMEKSADREERIKARKILREYRNKHGKYPY